jgi:trimeric autotransporter adhesin
MSFTSQTYNGDLNVGKGQLGLVVEYNAISNFDLWSQFPQRPHIYLITPSANIAITLPEVGNADYQATAGHRIIIKNNSPTYTISIQKFDTTPVKVLDNMNASMFVSTISGDWIVVDTESDTIQCDSFGNLILPETANLTGTQNVGYGCDALVALLNGDNNTAIGYQSGSGMINASDNTALGHETLQSLISGTGNICLGRGADVANPNSNNITVIGNNITGSINGALYFNLGIPNNIIGNVLKYNSATGQVGPDTSAVIPACDANNNLFVGSQPTTTGSSNAGFGCSALVGLTSGTRNTGIGRLALAQNNSGDQNTAIGFQSLTATTFGTGNVAVGVDALSSNITGSNNVAVGLGSLKNANSIENTSIGHSSLFNLTTGIRNVAVGFESALNSNGNDNISMGHRSLLSNTTGLRNVAIGNNAMSDNTIGNDNTTLGYDAMRMGINGSSNVAIGRGTLFVNVTGSGNTCIGTTAGQNIEGGINNIVIGQSADATQFANHITVIGAGVSGSVNRGLYFNTGLASLSGDVVVYDTATGQMGPDPTISVPINDVNNNLFAGASPNATGSNNTGYGDEALASLTTGNNNSGFGANSLTNVTSGNCNTAVGFNSGLNLTTGTGNTALGCKALDTPTVGNLNIAIGDDADVNDGLNNVTVIATGITGSVNRGLYFNTGLATLTGSVVVYDNATGQMGPDPSIVSTNIDGNNNIFTGSNPNATGSNNTGYGTDALASLTTGNNNSAFGADTLDNLTSGSCNNGLGFNALGSATTGNNNIGIGCNALDSVVTGSNNIGIGHNVDTSAGANHVTLIGIDITGSVPRGLYFNTGLATPSSGDIVIYDTTSGQMGPSSVLEASVVDGNNNVFTGTSPNTTGVNNSGFGYDALNALTSGSCNNALGYHSLYNLTTGTANVAIGCNALDSIVSGSNNIGIGHNVDSVAGADHVTIIGSGITGSITRGLYFNTGLASNASVQLLTYNPSTGQVGPNALISVPVVDANNNLFTGSSPNATGSNNTGYGDNALASLTTGNNNSAFGANALDNLTSGSCNNAFGFNSLGTLTTGTANVAIGCNALDSVITGSNNIGIGHNVDSVGGADHVTLIGSGITGSVARGLYFNTGLANVITGNYVRYNTSTGQLGPDPAPIGLVSDVNGNLIADETPSVTGSNNTGIGAGALSVLTTGNNNSAFGRDALNVNTIGINNTAIGSDSLSSNTSGGNNVAVGFQALNANTTGSTNTAVGNLALGSNISGSSNVAVGMNTLNANTFGMHNVGVGMNALLNNTTGSANVAVGRSALDINTTGINNTAVGYGSLGANTTGTGNVAVGFQAGDFIVTGVNNIAIGSNANMSAGADHIVVIGSGITGSIARGLYFNTGLASNASSTIVTYNTSTGQMGPNASLAVPAVDGNNNLIVGSAPSVTGSNNTGYGDNVLASLTTGNNNSAFGADALDALTSGTCNSGFGFNSLGSVTTGTANVAIGCNALDSIITGSNNIGIGFNVDSVGGADYVTLIGSGITGNIARGLYFNTGLANVTTGNYVRYNTSTGQLGPDPAPISGSGIPCDAFDNVFQEIPAGFATGTGNTAYGCGALSSLISGSTNLAIGNNALSSLVTGISVAIGNAVLLNATAGVNCGIGSAVLGNLTTGSGNICAGFSCCSDLLTGNSNIAFGTFCLDNSLNASENVLLGRNLLNINNVNFRNIVIGNDITPLTSVYVHENIAIGSELLTNLSTGYRNIAIGSSDLATNYGSVLTHNIGIGHDILVYGDTGVVIGRNSGVSTLSAFTDYITIGHMAYIAGNNALAIGNTVTAGSAGVAIGYLTSTTNADSAVAIGRNATAFLNGDSSVVIGLNSSSSANNGVAIGTGATTTATGSIAIGFGANATSSNGLYFSTGLATVSSVSVEYDTTTGQMGPISSSRRYKTDIVDTSIDTSKVLELNPVDFTWTTESQNGKKDFGLIAEDVNSLLPEIVPKDVEGNCIAVQYDKLGVLLIPEVKRLRSRIEQLESTLEAVLSKLNDLK